MKPRPQIVGPLIAAVLVWGVSSESALGMDRCFGHLTRRDLIFGGMGALAATQIPFTEASPAEGRRASIGTRSAPNSFFEEFRAEILERLAHFRDVALGAAPDDGYREVLQDPEVSGFDQRQIGEFIIPQFRRMFRRDLEILRALDEWETALPAPGPHQRRMHRDERELRGKLRTLNAANAQLLAGLIRGAEPDHSLTWTEIHRLFRLGSSDRRKALSYLKGNRRVAGLLKEWINTVALANASPRHAPSIPKEAYYLYPTLPEAIQFMRDLKAVVGKELVEEKGRESIP